MNTARQTQRGRRPNGGNIFSVTVVDVDLNYPPIEILLPEGNSSSANPHLSQGTSASNHKPIDLDAFENGIELLASLIPSQPRRLCRRNQPTTDQTIVILDDDSDTNSRTCLGNGVEITSSLHNIGKRGKFSNRNVINCETYPDDDHENAKGKKAMKSAPEPPKEPTFNCPVCMNALVEASSTICGHVFCQDCIKKSIQVQKKCPTCRRKLRMNNFHRVYLPSCE